MYATCGVNGYAEGVTSGMMESVECSLSLNGLRKCCFFLVHMKCWHCRVMSRRVQVRYKYSFIFMTSGCDSSSSFERCDVCVCTWKQVLCIEGGRIGWRY